MFVALSSCSSTVFAQTLSGTIFGGGGAFVCCQGQASAWQLGGGVDAFVDPHVSVGAAVSVVGPIGTGQIFQQISPHTGDTFDFGTGPYASGDVSFHFGSGGTGHARSFATVGYGGTFGRDAATFGVQFGGGVDWWLRERRGLRLELVDQTLREFGTTHVIIARGGLLFR